MERLDGNAIGGALGEVFAFETTEARGRCDSCGAVTVLAEAHVYVRPLSPGTVVRCSSCEAVLAVVIEAEGNLRLGLRGLTWIEVSAV